MSEAPHKHCQHILALRPAPCFADCIMADVEPLAEYHNRCEVAAEGSGEKVRRRCSCRLDEWQEFHDDIKRKVEAEEAERC